MMRKVAVIAAILALAGPAFAADKGGPPATLDQLLTMKDPVERPVSCHALAGAGFAIARAKATADSETLPIAATGTTGTLGGGCDYRMASVIIGGWAAYDIGKVTARITDGLSSTDLDLNKRWSVGARLGYYVQPTTILYGSVGYARAESDALDLKLKGIVLGAGLETKITGPLWFRFSGDYTRYGKEPLGLDAKLDTTLITTRAGLVWKF